MSHRIVLPRLMEVGAGASGQLARVLKELGCNRPLIVTDRMMVDLGYVARIAGQLEEAGIASQCFADTLPEPTAASIRAGVEMVREGDFDSIVALGGGSPIDRPRPSAYSASSAARCATTASRAMSAKPACR